MNYLQAIQEIADVVPDIQNEIAEDKTQDSYHLIQIFTNHIKNMIRQNDRNLLFKSLKKLNEIYRNGDTMLKNAIESIFIYSLDNFTGFSNEEYRKMIFNHISNELKIIYLRQIYKHGM